MFYKIHRSLGNISAVLVDTIPNVGVCVEFKNFGSDNASILVYTNGKLKDVCFNGCTFPCVYNNLRKSCGDDVYGGSYKYVVSFEFVDSVGDISEIKLKRIYGRTEPLVVEYFFSLLYNISCCSGMEQFKELYECIIDNNDFSFHKNRDKAVKILHFIDGFSLRLSEIQDDEYVAGLKQKLKVKYAVAQEVIASSSCPL